MNFVDFAIALGLAAAQAPPGYYYRGPAVVYVPPGYSQPAPMPPPVRQVVRPVQQPRALSRDEERERIIDAGERFCMKWPDDRVCHPKDGPQ
jgi:hypothetical protein